MPKWYHIKPVDVEAVQLTAENATRIATWCGGQLVEEIDPQDETLKAQGMNVPTLEGVKRAHRGDYIIKNGKGEFYVRSAQYFESRFERS